MRIWLPYVTCGSGTDVFTERLAHALDDLGHETILTPIPHKWQYFPWRCRLIRPPGRVDITVTNSWNGFVFRIPGSKLVVVDHLWLFDAAFSPYRSIYQAIFHYSMVRYFVRASLHAADAVVAVSRYTAEMISHTFSAVEPSVIYNGIDVSYFTLASEGKPELDGRKIRLLYVGNLSPRKGCDLLPKIMQCLGGHYELRYTAGLRTNDEGPSVPNMIPLGRQTQAQLLDQYRYADLLLFPSRLEGFGYAAAEAMACGTPVIATNGSSLTEVVEHGVTGYLCPMDDVEQFCSAVKNLVSDPERLGAMGLAARRRVVDLFSMKRMAEDYSKLFDRLLTQTRPAKGR
jgi:glycosyltransferase involved in cell wall biosynthesis